MGCVYAITAPSGKRYIGGATNFPKRQREHLSALRRGVHHNIPLQRAFQKYGALTFSVLLQCSDEMVPFYEQLALDRLACSYNINPSAVGSRGLKWSEEAKVRLRLSRGLPPTPRVRVRKGRVGIVQSKATRRKRAASLKGHPVSAATRAKIAAQKGWKHTEAAKQKMRVAKAARRSIVHTEVLA